MIEYYPQIKLLHVTTVLLSGALFAMRGIAVQLAADWAIATPVNRLSYTIDSLLLSSALALFVILPGAVFANHWLTVKLAFLVAYIGLGMYALRRGRTQRQKLWFFAAALLMYLSMFAIARSHHPLGPLLMLRG